MRSLHAGLVLALASVSPVRAEEPAPVEVGIYTGAFISNYYHQYYDADKFPGVEGEPGYRPELRRMSPLAGLRLAYFFTPWLAGEVDLNMVAAETKPTAMHAARESAHIYNGRLQLMFQAASLSRVVVPYVAIGTGFGRLSSHYLGSDTDYPPFIGAGARLLVSRSITLRVDGRWMRAPTPQEPYTLNCNLGELMVGISLRPTRGRSPDEPAQPPVTDRDGDGLLDHVDRCPNEAEDLDGFEDQDGCPELDNDHDGIADALDTCPLEPEDADGFQDADGCPDPDNDSDGIADASDACPAVPEDRDGFADDDGCPDLDNDGDGVSDAQDRCPNEAEVINGTEDDDGCPDRGNVLVVVSPDRIELLENIRFRKTTLQKSSFSLLGQLGATLRAHPEIRRLRITVHVQPTRKPEVDRQISEERATAIRDWLVGYGIDTNRLEPRGFGGSKPLVPPAARGAKVINERIELIVLDRK